MTTWQYAIVPMQASPTPWEKRLNDMGALGWELVAVSNCRAYFKRSGEHD